MIRLVFSTVIALVAGLYLGHRLADGAGERQSSHPAAWERSPDRELPAVARTAEPPVRSTLLRPADVQLLKRELASVVADLAQLALSPAGIPPVTHEAETAESMAADQSLRETVDAALAVGRWTADDAEAARGFAGQASAGAVGEAVTALVAAVNEQRLQLETNGPPF